MSKRLEELRKGCGKKFDFDSDANFIICNITELCQECQARIDEREKMEKEVKDVLKKDVMKNAGQWMITKYIRELQEELGLSEDGE